METKKCLNCGEEFESKSQVHKFCCTKCKKRYSTLKNVEGKSTVTCAICGIKKQDLSRHINSIHNINGAKYKEMYPNSPIMIKSIGKNRGKSIIEYNKNNPIPWNKGKSWSEEVKLKIGKSNSGEKTPRIKCNCLMCGKEFIKKVTSLQKYCSNKCSSLISTKHTKESKEKLSKALKVRTFSEEHKNKISNSVKKTKTSKEWKSSETYKNMCDNISNYRKGIIPWNTGLDISDERVAINTKNSVKTRNSEEWKNSDIGKDWIRKNKEWHRENSNPIRQSKQELYIRDNIIKHLGLPFNHDTGVKGVAGRPDFYFPTLNKVIEYNGCYWHNHACEMNSIDNPMKNPNNEKRWQEKIKSYDKCNIDYLVIWECEWINDPESVKQMIIDFLK